MTGLTRVFAVSRALELLDRKTPHASHFYLRIIGVDPAQQRRGIGGRLMQPVLDRCDREQIPAYLFSTKQQNVPLYERHGFRVLERVEVDGGPPLWTMWRDPRSAWLPRFVSGAVAARTAGDHAATRGR
jgi:GNAT superfamily N-acetyltransferase